MADHENTTNCPVAPLVTEVIALIKAHDEADNRILDCGCSEKHLINRKIEALTTRRLWVETSASHLYAKSGIGALFQLHLVMDHIDTLEGMISEKSEFAKNGEEARATAARLLYSLQAFIENLTGAKPENACDRWYMPADFNHLLFEQIETTTENQQAEAA